MTSYSEPLGFVEYQYDGEEGTVRMCSLKHFMRSFVFVTSP